MSEKIPRYRYLIVLTLFIALSVAYMGRVIVSVLAANETFLTDLGINGQQVQIGMLMTSFLIAYGVGNFILSPLGDYLGPRKAISLAMLVCGISMLLGGIATAMSIIIVSRVLLGASNGLHYPLQNIFVKNWFPVQERGRANASWVIAQSVAPALAMPFFTWIVGLFGWRFGFFSSALLCIIPLVMLWYFTADTPKEYKSITQAELNYITRDEEKITTTKNENLSVWEIIKLFAIDYKYWLLVYWYMSMAFMFWGLISWLPVYLKEARGFTWMEMGWLSSLPFILSIVMKGFGGWAIDKFGRYAPFLAFALFFGGVGIYLVTIIENKYLAAVVLAISFGITNMGTAPAWTLLQKIVPGKSLTIASGTMNGISNGVSSLSPLLIGLSISLTGRYEGGLYMLVGAGMIASVAALILAMKKY